MTVFRTFVGRLTAFARARERDRDIDDEIASHLAEAADEYVERGLSAAEARAAAARDFGGVTQVKQLHREMRSLPWLDDFHQDARYAFRRLTKDRAFTAVAVMTLGLGIGVSSALFSVIDATMLRPLPYPDPEQLVNLGPVEQAPDGPHRPAPSMEDMRTWQQASDVFSQVVGWGGAFRGRIVDDPEPQRIEVMHFTEGYLAMHGVKPLMGRDFTRADGETSSELVALLGYGYWQSRYAGRSDVIGETIRLDRETATIVGVLPAWFNAGVPLATPLRVPPQQFASRGTGRVTVYARLQPGVTLEHARERLTARMPAMHAPDGSVRAVSVWVESRLQDAVSSNRAIVGLLSVAVLLIVLIACVNVAGLLFARGTAREPELALRASLGAGRARLIRQLLAESILLAACGGAVGVLLAWLALDVLVANLPLSLPENSPIALNGTVLALTAALLVPTVVLFGLLPATRLSRARIPPLLARTSRQVGSAFSLRSSRALIMAETSLAIVLLAGAGLMIRSFVRISTMDLGFNPEGLLTLQVLPLEQTVPARKEYYGTLLQRIRTIPGVSSAGLIDNFALGDGTSYTDVVVDGREKFSSVFQVMPGYFETIGARLRSGRFLTDADYAAGFRGVVINESAARKLFPDGAAATGRTLLRNQSDPRPWTVLGVIADLRHRGPLDPRSLNEPQVFFPFPAGSDRSQSMMIVMRPEGNLRELAGQLPRLAQSIGPRVLVERIRTADEWFGERVMTPRRRMVLLGLLAALGLALALVGIFGMTAYAVARRTSEIGVRMAFGARPGQVVRAVVRDAAIPIVAGTLAGIGMATLAAPAIRSFLFETTPTDPATLLAVAVTLAAAGCLAALVPAQRAARVDPAITLRAE